MKSITTCLLFVGEQAGKAQQAIEFYTSLFADSAVDDIQYHEAGGPEREGSVKLARFHIGSTEVLAMDSALDHQFGFTPAMSLAVECESEAEITRVYERLSEHGATLMPLDNYGFSRRFAWLNDRFGVSWQLNLA
ncbi:VOC family protein [Bowmanella denitrificans]|uniref:VOC family protein n=1 Tax=Bowmanella denitrificans TaxID=366582 RepID=A0ABP3GAR2_9ALTE